MSSQARVFYCYAPEDGSLRDQLDRHLSLLQREGRVSGWDQRSILPGEVVQAEITGQLQSSNLVLILISADFMASESCQSLAQAALLLHKEQRLRLVPIIVRPVDWQSASFGELGVLPQKGKPVTTWADRDEAWLDVVVGLRRLLRQYGRSPEEPWAPANPYRGLETFEPEDEDLFFGREALTRKLWQAFRDLHGGPLRLLSILGPSGSGKSSVARAGLVPALRREPVPGPRPSQVVLFTPGERPIERLARALLPLLPIPAAALPAAQILEVEQVLRHRNDKGEADGLRRLASTVPEVGRAPLLIVVDQFEETYSQCKDRAERDLLVGLLLHAAGDGERHVSVVLTLRSDFLGETHQHPLMNQAITGSGVMVGVMSPEEMRTAIARPAEVAGHPLPESTVTLLLEQTQGRDGALPLLEFALQRIWEGLVSGKDADTTLRDIGGVGGALAGRAQELYERLSPTDQTVARRLFLALVQLGDGTKDTRRRVPFPELVSHEEAADRVREVVRRFSLAGSRLVTVAMVDQTEVVEVTHEALFDHWQALKDWLDAGREDVRVHRRLAEVASDWGRRHRPLGLLWRPPDLDLLHAFHGRAASDMTALQIDFWRESEQAQQAEARARRQARRQTMATVALAGIAIIVGVSAWAVKERQRTFEARKFAHDTEQELLAGYVEQGRQELLKGQPLRALLWLDRAYGKIEGLSTATTTLLAEAMIPIEAVQRSLEGHEGSVRAVAFSPDGAGLVTASDDKTAKLWDAHSGKVLFSLEGHQAKVTAVAFSPDGARVVTASDDKTAKLWDAHSGKLLFSLEGHQAEVTAVTFSPDGARVVTASDDKTAKLWDAHSGKLLFSLVGHRAKMTAVAFSPDGARVVSGSGYDTDTHLDYRDYTHLQADHQARLQSVAKLWDAHSGKLLSSLVGHESSVTAVAFSPDGARVVTASGDKTARLWDAHSGKLLSSLVGHQARVTAVAFSPNGTGVVTASDDNTAKMWDTHSGKVLFSLVGHQKGLTAVAFSSDGARVVTASYDNTAKLWDVHRRDLSSQWEADQDSSRLLSSLEGHEFAVNAVAFSPDGARVVTGSDDNTARLWDTHKGKLLSSMGDRRGKVNAVAFSPDGARIVTGDWDTAKLWDAGSGKLLSSLEGHQGKVNAVAFSPDGARVVTGSDDNTARLWDAGNGKLLSSLEGHQGKVNAVAFSPDGARVVTGSDDNTAKLWDGHSGKLLSSLEGHQGKVNAVAFNPDGTRVVTTSDDNTAKLWDAHSGKILSSLGSHEVHIHAQTLSPNGACVVTGQHARMTLWDAGSGKLISSLAAEEITLTAVACSPDGGRVVTATMHGRANLWDAHSGKLLSSLEGHQAGVTAVAFSPNGTRVVTASNDNTAKLWDAHTGRLLTSLEGHQGSVRAVAFSPDGARVLTGSDDGTAKLWDVHMETRPKSEIDLLIRCRVPLHLEGDVIVPTSSPDRQGCDKVGGSLP